MIIETKAGKHRSVITDRELQDDLRKRLSNMNDAERHALRYLMDEMMVAGSEVEEIPYESDQDVRKLSDAFRTMSNMHYEGPVVSVKEFILEREYMGHIGGYLYPGWLADLIELNSKPYNEIILTGSIGTGKTTMADLGLAYAFYELCMLRDPQATFGLMPGSDMLLVCFNRDDYLARNVTFKGFKDKIKDSPFFKRLGLKITDSSVKYEAKNIEVIAASAKSAKSLGRNVFGGIIDESDFIDGGSVLKDKELAAGERSTVDLLHSNILRRMKSRFDNAGILPGKLFLTSSAKDIDSFTNKRIGEASVDSMVFCRDYAQYEIKPPEKFSKERFWVRVGNERVPHKILSRREYESLGKNGRLRLEKNGCRFIRVPLNFKPDFERNIEDAIRDIAGIVTVSSMPFFQMRSRIYDIIDETLPIPVNVTEWQQDTPLEINWSAITKKYRHKVGPGQYRTHLGPKRHPDAVRFVHFDLSRGVQDPAGICIGHVVDYITMERRANDGEPFKEEVPLIELDLVLRILAPPGKEIDFAEIRAIVYAFQRHGYSFGFCSMDSFQSHEMLTELDKKGVEGEVVSVDKTVEHYTILKTAIYEGRLNVYNYPILIHELEKLKRNDREKPAVDHPPNGTKDVADAVCGVASALTTRAVDIGAVELGISEYRDVESEKSEWIRSTMHKAGDDAPIEANEYDAPLFYTG